MVGVRGRLVTSPRRGPCLGHFYFWTVPNAIISALV